MTCPLPVSDASPPRWAEAALRALLKPRDRDTVTGDLLEEYREAVVPALGVFRARLWYLRQALSLMTLAGCCQAAVGSVGRNGMVLWAAAAAVVEYTFIFLVPGRLGLPLGLSLFVLITAALGISGATAIRSAADVRFLWRASWLWGFLFAAAMAARIAVDARGAAVAVILMAAGFRGAWRTGEVRTGILTAMAASVIGSLLTIAVVALGLPIGIGNPHPPIASGLFVLLAISTVVGTVGAMFGSEYNRKGDTLC